MPDAIISVERLGKRYHIAHQRERQRYVALRDVIAEKAKGFFSRSQKSEVRSQTFDLRSPTSGPASHEDFWALKDVSFEVKRGEVIGIIGRNGAGKSTLLKILSRITEPTEGRVCIDGRVASLLEVGTGFHPELTGRENIFLNGAILGMHRAEIKQKFDEIVAFAEVEKFLDTPVKRYSSGMYVRLAFAVAAHLEPEILIVDEVLAVGDAEFQKKCLGKIKDVATKEGRTVLFVSHNMAAVQALCHNGILLNDGRILVRGSVRDVVAKYSASDKATAQVTAGRAFSGKISLTRLESFPAVVKQHEAMTFSLELASHADDVISDLALQIHAPGGEQVSLIDLRSATGPYRLQAGRRLILKGYVDNLPYVENDFNVGLYINADSVCQSFLNLFTFSVLPCQSEGVIPREPQFRGLVELKARVEHRVV
jgi:lipopolysaccharide transport system ATP-binding protein